MMADHDVDLFYNFKLHCTDPLWGHNICFSFYAEDVCGILLRHADILLNPTD